MDPENEVSILDIMEDGVKKCLAEAKIDIIDNSLITHSSRHFIVDGKQVCKA